jgi:hypothetical protein
MRRTISTIAVATLSLGLLTACDPPTPEALLVAQAESEVQCGDPGAATMFLDGGFIDLGYSWQEMLLGACPDLTLEIVDDKSSAQMIAAAIAPECPAFAIGPVGYDGAAIVFYLDEAFSLNLNPEAIQGIFSGSITNWADPIIQDINPDVELPDADILVNASSAQPAIEAMQDWVAYLTGTSVSFGLLQDDPEAYFFDLSMELEPGGIALIPMSDALGAGATIANIVLEDGTTILPESQSLYAGSTMFSFETEETSVTSKFDHSIEPKPFPGETEAVAPYAAMYPVKLYLCGEDNLTVRALARYFVRLDAQGIIATTTLQALGEDVRIASAVVLGRGLPLPESVMPEEN